MLVIVEGIGSADIGGQRLGLQIHIVAGHELEQIQQVARANAKHCPALLIDSLWFLPNHARHDTTGLVWPSRSESNLFFKGDTGSF